MIQNLNLTQVFLTFPIAGHARPGWAEIRSGPGPARARYFIFHHIPITPIGGPGPGPGPAFYLSSPYTHHSYWQVFYLSSPYTHHSYWQVFYFSSLYSHQSTIPKNSRVVFLGKIKEYVACKQPDKEDKIPSKVTREGSKCKSVFS